MLRPPTAKKIIRFAVNAKMWYSGSTVSITSSPSTIRGFHVSRPWTTLAIRLPVREDRALGDAGGASGVLQRRWWTPASAPRRTREHRRPERSVPGPSASASRNGTWAKVAGGIIFLTYFWTARTTKRFSGGSRSATLTSTTWRIVVFGRTSATLLAKMSIAMSADGAAVGKLMLHLRRRVERVGVDHHQPRLQAAKHRHRIGQAVRHLQRHAIAVREAGDLAQIHGELVREPIDVAVGDGALRAVRQEQREGRALAVLVDGSTDERREMRRRQRRQILWRSAHGNAVSRAGSRPAFYSRLPPANEGRTLSLLTTVPFRTAGVPEPMQTNPAPEKEL